MQVESHPFSPPSEIAFSMPFEKWALCGPRSIAPLQFLHARVEQLASEHPQELAVIFEGEEKTTRLTYSQLDRRVNALSWDLYTNWGVQAGELVGVSLDLSIEGIIAFLALNKLGAAPYFLDASTPSERLNFLLQSAGVRLLLTQEQIHIQLEEAHAPQIDISSLDTIAYAIATSGTTGDPKGVPITHRSLANYSLALRRLYDIQPGDRILEVYSFHFDAAIAQISLALSTGATLCFGTRSKLGNGPAILDFMQNHHIHHAAFTPSLLADIPPSLLPSLRSIECGGERCSRALTSWASGRNFYNVYGPTETAIGATYAKCYADDTGEVPIGFPFTNVWIGIIDDEKLHPVQHGEVGEIVIGGLGVSPGYLNRPELTSQQFITIEGETCYRTGDLGVVIDNNLWYRGRKEGDLEVKLAGGRRFNLGEIEAKLLELPSILLCAAGLWDGRLLVYLMGHTDVPRPDDRELQAYLSSWLPEYAVPQYFQWLVRLPLNSNGKVIRALLPTPDWQALLSQGVEPGTQTELKLAETLSKMVLFPLAETFGGGKYSLAQPSTKIDTSKTFAQLGLDSLSATDFLLHLGINSIDEGRLLRLTLQQLAQMIDQEET